MRAAVLLACALPLLVPLATAARAEGSAAKRLAADGRPVPVEIKTPGQKVAFVFGLRSGCRYRLTVEPGTLERPVVDLALGEVAQRFGAPERGRPAVHEWDAEGERVARAEVQGFSALTGSARVRLEALGPDGRPQARPRPWLAPGGERGRVGDLILGEADRWDLHVEPGRAYEVEPLPGTAAGVLLSVRPAAGGEALAASTRPWRPFDPLRFRVPEAPPPVPAAPGEAAAPPPGATAPTPFVLEVQGQGGAGGTYGLRLSALPPEAAVDPSPGAQPGTQVDDPPPAPVGRGPLEGEPLGMKLDAGDVAILYAPMGAGAIASTQLAARVGGAWVPVGPAAQSATMRTPEGQHLAWFRAAAPGAYRFGPPGTARAGGPPPLLVAAEQVGAAPLLIAVTGDPSVRVRAGPAWKAAAVGVVMPGFDYLFVAEEAPSEGVAMRVVTLEGRVLATRPASGDGLTYAQGYGPSLRFRVGAPGAVRLEVKGSRLLVRALLRRASN